MKQRPRLLARLAVGLMVVRAVDLFWLVAPNFHEEGFHLHWLDVAAPVGLGAAWLALFLAQLRQRPLLPVNDPYFGEAMTDVHH